jgi:hypothetical protein
VCWSGSGYGQVTGRCEYGNEPSVCIKCGEFLDWLLKKNGVAWSAEGNVWPCRSNWHGGHQTAGSRHLHVTAICGTQLCLPFVNWLTRFSLNPVIFMQHVFRFRAFRPWIPYKQRFMRFYFFGLLSSGEYCVQVRTCRCACWILSVFPCRGDMRKSAVFVTPYPFSIQFWLFVSVFIN